MRHKLFHLEIDRLGRKNIILLYFNNIKLLITNYNNR